MASFFDLKARKAAAAANGNADQKQDKPSNARTQPWVEKYRPKTLSDVTAQDHTVDVLQRTLQSSNLPHMLFYGPPGTGKNFDSSGTRQGTIRPRYDKIESARAQCLRRAWYLIVREKVKNFARMQLTNPAPGYKDKYPCPPFKIIILDEADSMTQDAQSALRRTMETYSKITRFCLICNYSLDQSNAKRRLKEIAEKEGVALEDGAVDALINAARLVSANAPDKEAEGDEVMDVDKKAVTVKIVEDIAGVIPDTTIDDLVKAIRPKRSGSSYQIISDVVEKLVADGWSAGQVVNQKNKIVLVFSEVDKRLVDGADEHLSILDLSVRISNIMSKK
ncbi:replication factor C subunit 2 [Fusarium oxysporum]|nr:replication factor C subunit 2 [Fusarium oxysporum]